MYRTQVLDNCRTARVVRRPALSRLAVAHRGTRPRAAPEDIPSPGGRPSDPNDEFGNTNSISDWLEAGPARPGSPRPMPAGGAPPAPDSQQLRQGSQGQRRQ